MSDGDAAVTVAVALLIVNDPSTSGRPMYEVDVPPEQCVTYVPGETADPVSVVTKDVSDDAYTPHVGSVVQSLATVDGEVV